MPNSTDPTGPAQSKRFAMGLNARGLVGCHYLWGAAGAKPGPNGGSGGAPYRPGSVNWEPNEINDPAQVMVWAASCSVQRKRICCGRYNTIDGGRSANPTDWDLNNYLASLRQMRDDGQGAESWPSYFWHFTPRWAEWMDDTLGWQRQLLWGEDCRDIQHFDCIGFINFLLTKWNTPLLPKNGNGDIAWFSNNLEDVSSQEPWPADILFRGTDHIGVVSDDPASAVSALESVSGVVLESYSAGSDSAGYTSGSSPSGAWSKRCRLRDNQLL